MCVCVCVRGTKAYAGLILTHIMKVGWDFIQLYNINVLRTLLFWHIHASYLHVFGSRESDAREAGERGLCEKWNTSFVRRISEIRKGLTCVGPMVFYFLCWCAKKCIEKQFYRFFDIYSLRSCANLVVSALIILIT